MSINIEELILNLYNYGIIKFGKFKLSSGLESSYYIDFRQAISIPSIYEKIVKLSIEKVKNVDFDIVVGVESGGIPWASMIAYELRKPMAYIRKEVKQHGTQKLIEGLINPGMKVLLVDDVITTGSSILKSIEVLEKHGLTVRKILVFVARGEGGFEKIKSMGYNIDALFTINDIFNVLRKFGINVPQ